MRTTQVSSYGSMEDRPSSDDDIEESSVRGSKEAVEEERHDVGYHHQQDNNTRRRSIVAISSSIVVLLSVIAIISLVPLPLTRTSNSIVDSSSTKAAGIIHIIHAGTTTSDKIAHHDVPFPYIDRAEFGTNPVPAEKIVNRELFSQSLIGTDNNDDDENNASSFLKVPFPTGAFWTNLVIKPTDDRFLSYPIMAYPYAFKWNPDMVQVSLPSLRNLMDSISIRQIFNPDLTLSTVETVTQRYINYFDPLSVTLHFQAERSNELWETYIVEGSPYVTARYEEMTPSIHALSIFKSFSCLEEDKNNKDRSNLFCTSLVGDDNGEENPNNVVRLHGTRFVIQTLENLTWLLFVSEPVTLVFDTIHKTKIITEDKFTGILRLALIPPPIPELTQYTNRFPQVYDSVVQQEKGNNSTSTGVQMLIKHATTYPVGADLTWSFPSENIGNLQFQFKTNYMGKFPKQQESSDLLMLALPHHAEALAVSSSYSSKNYRILNDEKDFDLIYRTIKGPMTPILGSIWSYDEHLTTIGFDDDAALKQAAELHPTIKATILDQVVLDVERLLPTFDENVYGYGKQVARLSQLVHIAHVLLDDYDSPSSLNQKYSSTVKDSQRVLLDCLTAFLTGKTVDGLVYDTNFGGLVTKDGLNDFMNDFGNGWYNDHHFHYGYYLYACALMGQWNSSFVAEYGTRIDAMMFDVAHSGHASSDDRNTKVFFPLARHKAWFDGHSFASGLFPFASGKSMESSSESINCYYGAYLWSMIRRKDRHNSDQFNFARLLLATEKRGIKTYWHMKPASSGKSTNKAGLFNPTFSKNSMIGNLGMMDATVSTWFGNNPLYVHMINFMPITAFTRELFDKAYLQEEYNNIIKPIYGNVEMAWKGYVVCDRGMIEPNQAWKDALGIRSFELDQAISQSQVLYFIATMPGFQGSDHVESDLTVSEKDGESYGLSARCVDHQACATLGLTGNCCPPSPGSHNLGCCDIVKTLEQLTEIGEKQSRSAGNASCSENQGCAALGLSGDCCPTPAGVTLGCCD